MCSFAKLLCSFACKELKSFVTQKKLQLLKKKVLRSPEKLRLLTKFWGLQIFYDQGNTKCVRESKAQKLIILTSQFFFNTFIYIYLFVLYGPSQTCSEYVSGLQQHFSEIIDTGCTNTHAHKHNR